MGRSSEPVSINSTYRVQLSKDYTIRDLILDLEYIHSLGVTHLYLSPVLESAKGSNHGYDVTNPFEISEERGGEKAFTDLDWRLRNFDPPMGMILDIVPNHMAAIGQNTLWYDVLRRGAASPYRKVFDTRIAEGEKIDLPVLGDTLVKTLDREEIKVVRNGKRGWEIIYYDHYFPVCPEMEVKCHPGMTKHEIASLLDEQHYRLVCWKEIFHKIDYRRFFDISGLIAVRMEDLAVFDLLHRKLFEMFNKYQTITGVRVDHVDGMKFPGQYLKRLEREIPDVWVEKILMPGETLPSEWPVAGTTGYEFAAKLNDVLVSPEGFSKIHDFWCEEVSKSSAGFSDCVFVSKKEVLYQQFQPELSSLCKFGQDRSFWIDVTAAMPVYRTYVSPSGYTQKDLDNISTAASVSGREDTLTLLSPEDPQNHEALFCWQQLTGPAMAKGLEDTAHYRFTPLACFNEVGCEVKITEDGRQAFYKWLNDIAWRWPLSMKATSTHDTKRSEDVRARLMALSDIPDNWIEFIRESWVINEHFKTAMNGKAKPGIDTEYLYLQTLVGIWPLEGKPGKDFVQRVTDYMIKAAREAKQETNWLAPDHEYEKALTRFIEKSLSHEPFLRHVSDFSKKLGWLGALNSLAALTLKILTPGTPDIYQGTEIWNFTLVDPDNRRAVDFEIFKKILRCSGQASFMEDRLHWKTGEIKLWMTKRLLEIRRNHLLPEHDLKLEALPADGPDTANIIAYDLVREHNVKKGIMVAIATNAGRLPVGVLPEELRIPPNAWSGSVIAVPERMEQQRVVDLITGREFICEGGKLSAAYVFQEFPVAVFTVL